jgi:putative transposase
MDESHLIAAVRYVSLNPVRANLVAQEQDWPWSSVRAHLKGDDDGLVAVAPVLARVPDFPALLADSADQGFGALRTAEISGRPLGNDEFIAGLERILARRIARRTPGRKPKSSHHGQIQLL